MPDPTPDLPSALELVLERLGEHGIVVTAKDDEVRATSSWGAEKLDARFDRGRSLVGQPRDLSVPYAALVTVGEPDGAPTLWGTVSGELMTAQVVTGAGWVRLSAPIAPSGAYAPFVGELFDLARQVSGSSVNDRGWAFRCLEDEGLRSASRYLAPSGAGLTGVSVLTFAAGLVFPEIPALALAASAAMQVGLPAGCVMVGASWARKKVLLKAHSAGAPAAAALKRSGLFDTVDPPRPGTPLWPSVVVPTLSQTRRLVSATVKTLLLRARSVTRELDLRVALRSVVWPDNPQPRALLLPRAWAVAELRAPPEKLDGLPSGPREVRRADGVGWLFDADELEAEGLQRHLSDVSSALRDGPAGPYR